MTNRTNATAMNKRLRHTETLVYYDGPQVLVAQDEVATRHVCYLIDSVEGSGSFICVPVSPRRLERFRLQQIDLLTIVKEPEVEFVLRATAEADDPRILHATETLARSIPSHELPDPDFFLPMLPATESTVVKETQERHRAIMHCSLSPPESMDEPKISAVHLSQASRLLQRLVKHAYRKSIRDLDEPIRNEIAAEAYYRLDVFAFSEGSFTLHMQSAVPGDLVGYVYISRAFQLIDEVTKLIDEPEIATSRVGEIGGHFAVAFRDLIRFISETDTPISYEWSMPERAVSTKRDISKRQAKPLYERLSERVDIRGERVVLVGRLTKVDEKWGTWRLESVDEPREFSGTTDPDSAVDLAGLIIETQIYEFTCEERLEEELGTGKEFTKLYLLSHRPVSSTSAGGDVR